MEKPTSLPVDPCYMPTWRSLDENALGDASGGHGAIDKQESSGNMLSNKCMSLKQVSPSEVW